MTTLEPTSFLFEIAEGKPIPLNKLAYFQTRLRYSLYDFIVLKFKEMERDRGLTKAELARRIGCKPEQITRRLGAPGNWTLDTISDLLIGIAGEELEPKSSSVFGRANRNNDEKSWRANTENARPSKTRSIKLPKSALQANANSALPSASSRHNTIIQSPLNMSQSIKRHSVMEART